MPPVEHPPSSIVTSGLVELHKRYESLPSFTHISHVNAAVTWVPNDNTASRATATANTVGAIEKDDKRTPILGHEQWEFEKQGYSWRITSFIYNLCLP